MTFRPDPSAVKLCNRALSRVAQEPIAGIDPPDPSGSKAARACARWYKPVVARLLESHHFGLARSRATLTEETNDRTNEWLYKYALPIEAAFPVSLEPISGASGIQYYRGLGGLLAMLQGRPVFLQIGRSLYSRIAGALDFVSYDITEADFNATFENVVELTLAAAIAYDLIKSRPREEDLRQQATSALNLAIAQDLNAGNPRYGDQLSDRDIVRGAGYGMPWDWWPGPR